MWTSNPALSKFLLTKPADEKVEKVPEGFVIIKTSFFCYSDHISNFFFVFNPVPTAVPPNASSYNAGKICSIRLTALSSWVTYPLNSCPSVNGVASL